jgi:hypothetical protein
VTASGDSGSARLKEALDVPVHTSGGERRFGDLTVVEVDSRARELKDVGGWGPLQRVVPVARAWGELARAMRDEGAATVSDLEPDAVVTHAERTWVLPPPDGLI